MGREKERIAKRLEKNKIVECNRIQKKFYPRLFAKFSDTKDPRNASYIEYTNKEMLGTIYHKDLAGIENIQAMMRKFNDNKVVRNL